jgi:prepilin-type processing-associated H-X9-DG protein
MIALGDAILIPDSQRTGDPLAGNLGLDGFAGSPQGYDSVMPGLPAKDSAVRAMKQRHGWRWNIGFCDGHLENLRPSGVFDIHNPEQMRRWNTDNQPHDHYYVGPLP